MKLTHIRHSIRENGKKHLSKEGLILAKNVGSKLGDFDFVITSESFRAIETAIAMGYPIDLTISFGGLDSMSSNDQKNQMPENPSFQIFYMGYAGREDVKQFGQGCKKTISDALEKLNLKPDSNILLVSHSGIIELTTFAFLNSKKDFTHLGAVSDFCEGVILDFQDGQCINSQKFSNKLT